MTDQDLLKRVTALEDLEAIKRLKRTYCYIADDAINGNPAAWNDLMSRWVDDCWADFGPFGVHRGKEAVASFFTNTVSGFLSYSAHMVANPIIDIDGDTATGRWYVDVPCTLRAPDRAAWLQAKYDEEYVKVGGAWKWKSITARFDFLSPFEEGWVKTPMIES